MSKTQTHLKPKDTFEVHYYSLLNGEDMRVLNLLYQPIIGGNALVLYQHLITNATMFKEPTRHFTLQDMMSYSLQEVSEARVKLEAIGLVKTYVRKKDDGYHYIYFLENILPPHVFLSDDALCLMLLDRVGEERFNSLIELFKPKKIDLDGYTNITSNYVDVFHISQERLVQENSILSTASNEMKHVPSTKKTVPETDSFDWQFFLDSISGLKLDQDFLDNEFKPIVLTVHGLYGINELEMSQHVKFCTDYVTNQIDVKAFKHRIYKQYHQLNQSSQPNKSVNQPVTYTMQQLDRHKNDLKHQGFTTPEIEVIVSCEKIPPLVFLKAIKEQKNGFVAQNERWTIENLKTQSPLPDEVINMLIHYSLVVLDNPSINQNMVNTIANDWAQHKITKASEALKQVKNHKKESVNKQVKKSYNKNYTKKPIRTETLPEWAKESSTRKETPLLGDELLQLEQQLKQFNQGGESS
ncbi:replication initiation and membrane attachment family protein [Vagococcus sp. JNUCC 83]